MIILSRGHGREAVTRVLQLTNKEEGGRGDQVCVAHWQAQEREGEQRSVAIQHVTT